MLKSDDFVPAFLEGNVPGMLNSSLQFSGPSYTIGRAKATEVNLPLIDVNISRKHCEFSFDKQSKTWSIQDFSSNGVTVNGIRIDKNKLVILKSGDNVILSEQNEKYNWTFNVGELKRKSPDEEDAPPSKRPRLNPAAKYDSQKLDDVVSEVRKVAEVRMLREKLRLENIAKISQQKVEALQAEKELLVSRLERQVKDQAVKDKEAREQLAKEMEGKVDHDEIMKQFEENLRLEKEKAEQIRSDLVKEMEEKIVKEELSRKEEIEERDKRLEQLNDEKKELSEKLEKEKEMMDKELTDLRLRLNEENSSKETLEKEWQSKLTSMTSKMEESMRKEKEEMEKQMTKEKMEKESLEKEMENQKTLRISELKKLEAELEAERASHALALETVKEEQEQRDELLTQKEKEIEERNQQQLKFARDMSDQLAELERRKKEVEDQMELVNAIKDSNIHDDENVKESNVENLEKEINAIADMEKIQVGILSNLTEMLEREYQCSTCLDLYICPVALNCGHTFCWLCLARWKNSAGRTRGDLGTCPECREVVKTENRVIKMEHLIDGFMEQLGEEKKKEREQKVKERNVDFSDPLAQGKDVNYLFSFWDKNFDRDHSDHFNFHEVNRNANVLLFACDFGVSVNLSTQLSFVGRQWRCKSVISSTHNIFYHNKQYFKVGNETIEDFNETTIFGATFLAYEIYDEQESYLDENLSYAGPECKRLAESAFDKRKGDRHIDKKHRYYNTFEKLCEEIKTETGMETICCICLELKSMTSCSNVNTFSRDKIDKYVVELDLTVNKDGNYYVCWTCKQALNKNKEPTRAQKEFLGFLDFPEDFKNEVRSICKPNNTLTNVADLNKLENFLLKLMIPFMTIRHMKGPYLKVVGDMVLISSNLCHSLNKILPLPQEIIPVAFRKRMQYKGHYIQEYVDRNKIHAYFNFFKKYNHLYQDYEFIDDALNAFENEIVRKISNEGNDSSSDEEDDFHSSADHNETLFGTASLITDKYKEDSSAPTVANRLAEMIVEFESVSDEIVDDDKTRIVDPHDEFYYEDLEDFYEEFVEDHDDIAIEDLSNQDVEIFELYKSSRREVKIFNENSLKQGCKCSLIKICGIIMQHYNKLIKLKPESQNLVQLIRLKETELNQLVETLNELISAKDQCHHPVNEVGNLLKYFIYDKKKKHEDLENFIVSQRREIQKNFDKISVAPGEGGKWENWASDIFLEEKLFPALFPYGMYGYLSSNFLKKSNIGFSNYIKSRLLSVNPKFRNDPCYVFFLLLVKESVDSKRSEATYLRKATKVPKLNASFIKENPTADLLRYNNAYTTFKTMRGTAPYFEDVKKRLMATIRQKGAPSLFVTLSCAEYDWIHLAQKIYETKHKVKVSLEFIQQQSQAWRNKLINENVVQSTVHFAKRTDKIISLITKNPIFEHEGVKYYVSSYFFRTEFQARGAPHEHCMFWLEGENGETPPTLNSEENGEINFNKNATLVADFGSSLICGSSTDVHCKTHEIYAHACEECKNLKQLIERYQTHSHRPTCLKRKKYTHIAPNEGHGRLDGSRDGEELLVEVCRFNFPKNPAHKTVFLSMFPTDYDKNDLKKAKQDYSKIRKYLLRLTHGENFRSREEWLNFLNLTFNEYLFEVGMFEKYEDIHNENALANALRRYYTALRCEVKSTGLLLIKRNTCDVFTNNFNKTLIKMHEANQDIQLIFDEYAVAEYISDYCTKQESGQTSLLKKINDEAIKSGESCMDTIKKLSNALDKGRECGIQEALYRVLGLSMTRFSSIVKFINTNHPDHREGLLKASMDDLEEGESIFHNSLHDYYQDRPKNTPDDDIDWENMTLAEFVADFNISKSKPSSPNAIALQNKRGYVLQRNRECVLRYFYKFEHENEYYRALCILFLPFRNEMRDIHMKDVQLLYKENESFIESIRSHFEKHRNIVDRVREVEEKKDLDDEDSDDDDDNYFSDDETTTAEEMKDFQKYVKAQAKQQLKKYKDGKQTMTDDEYLIHVNSLNQQQRKIFNDFVERIKDTEEKIPFYLYIGGEAGTGKSFLLKLMIEAVNNQIPHYSGQPLDKPYSITIAPTGVAAFIVDGSTIESALGIQVNDKRKGYSRNNASKNSDLRFLYEDLVVIFLDEVSMVGADKLTKINYRMQEIMGNEKFMGGVSVVCTGDFGQLPPVKESMIWENSYIDNRLDLSPNFWKENFRIYYLTEKMRSQDEVFSRISDKVRKGTCDSEVLNFMKSRVTKCQSEDVNDNYKLGKLSIIVLNNDHKDMINLEKLEKLLPNERSHTIIAKDESTNKRAPPKIPQNLPLTRTGQLETNLQIKVGAPVMITSNHQQQRYKNNGIVNGSRGFIDSIQFSRENSEEIEIIWVRFNDDKTGRLLREDNKSLLNFHKPHDLMSVPIRKQRKRFQLPGHNNILREQFPLTLCYANTSHKGQGLTLDEVIADFSNAKRIFPGSFYTALSRVRYGRNFYLRDFKPEYIVATPNVERVLNTMKLSVPYIFKKLYLSDEIFDEPAKEMKIGYVNINELYTGMSDTFLNNDENLLNLDILAVADTRLEDKQTTDELKRRLSNWNILCRFDANDGRKHMGLLLLQSKSSTRLEIKKETIECKKWTEEQKGNVLVFAQHILLSIKDLQISFIYIRETPSMRDIQRINKTLHSANLIMGDLNLDPNRDNDYEKLAVLTGNFKKRVLHETTFRWGNQLDHIILQNDLYPDHFCTSYTNHTT